MGEMMVSTQIAGLCAVNPSGFEKVPHAMGLCEPVKKRVSTIVLPCFDPNTEISEEITDAFNNPSPNMQPGELFMRLLIELIPP